MSIKVAYSTGFWCTNIGNAFFSLGVEYVLKQVLGEENVTIVSDYQTYTTGYGKRLYPDKRQLEYLTDLKVDYLVLAGPVISRYFLDLWQNILLNLEHRGIGYIILSAGMMKLDDKSLSKCQEFFKQHPPFVFVSREKKTFETFGKYAKHAYDGICFSFFAPDYYHPSEIEKRYITLNFDKISEPQIWADDISKDALFEYNGKQYHVKHTGLFSKMAAKTDRFSDALIYATSILPQRKRADKIDEYVVIRTDHRFHPHYRKKIYNQHNSFCADLPYGYLNLYANSELTLSDRVHACAVTLAFGHSAMLFAKTNRVGLLERVGAGEISEHPVNLNGGKIGLEKLKMIEWLKEVFS